MRTRPLHSSYPLPHLLILVQVLLIHESYAKDTGTKFVCGTEDGDIVFGDWTLKQSSGTRTRPLHPLPPYQCRPTPPVYRH
jgi:hypothetical protein